MSFSTLTLLLRAPIDPLESMIIERADGVLDREPGFVGLDPYNKYVSRSSDSNVPEVEER